MSGRHRDDDAAQRPLEEQGETPETHPLESDPNADSPEGLAGGMGVSSERTGPVRGIPGEATYGAAPYPEGEEGPPPVDPDLDQDETPPEKSAHDDIPETNPPSPGKHRFDPQKHPGHGI
jgi:hypothetical protein